MIRKLLIAVMVIPPLLAHGQYFQYSQYGFTGQRVNPGMVAASDYAAAELIFRNQETGAPDVRLQSSMISVTYPFLSPRNGKRWSGLGLSLMDDRSGGIFAVQEAAATYAINVYLDRFRFLSLGFRGLYQKRDVSLTGLYTESQYIADRGFDPSLASGENFGFLRSDFFTISAGLYWQQDDRAGEKLAWWGISFFDLNKPQDSFSGIDSELSSTLVATGGLRILRRDNFAVAPDVLLTRSSGRTSVAVGGTTAYSLRRSQNAGTGKVVIITRYVPGRSGILGLQFHRDNFSVGFSYDIPVSASNPSNRGAFEVGVAIRKMVDPRMKGRSLSRIKSGSRKGSRAVPGPAGTISHAVARDSAAAPEAGSAARREVAGDLRASLKAKSDSVIASAKAGPVSHEPFIIEKLTLRFNFEFNSSELDDASKAYLNDLTAALKENLLMKVRLTGHTDNIGSPSFNQRLSVYRATVVQWYLIGRGIDPSRIEAEGRGLTEPLNDNKTEEERALNRRVELVIYYQQ